MPFKAILEDLTAMSKAEGAIMLDWEGEAVDFFSSSADLQLAEIGAHKGIILNMLKEVSANHSEGNRIKHIGITTNNYNIAISTLKDDYYILVTLKKNSSIGRAFYESRKAARKIEKEMG
ncbi:MAG: hypothetical protein KAS88_00985 [Deltaproteobacteria bacterium]|nr:hypothetical protein [Deltaproteobacteria bacterium]